MSTLNQAQSDAIKEIVFDYLVRGEDTADIKWRLKKLASKQNCKKLFQQVTLDDNSLNDSLVIAILASSDINPSNGQNKQELYEELIDESENLLELLENIYNRGNHHLGYLLKQIKHTRPPHNWALYFGLGALFSGGVGGLYYFKPHYFEIVGNWFVDTFPFAVKWIGATFSLLHNIPLLGIAWNLITLSWIWYQTYASSTSNVSSFQINRALFITFNTALIIAAYGLTYLAAGIMTQPAALLLIAGSGTVNVIARAHMLWNLRKPEILTNPKQKQNWKDVVAYERDKNLYQRVWRSFRVEVIAAAFITASVVVWCVCPPSIILSLSCLVFGWLVVLAREARFAHIKRQSAAELQAVIKEINTDVNVKKSSDLIPNITQEQKDLAQQVKEQKEEIAYLRQHLSDHNIPFTNFKQGATQLNFFTPKDKDETRATRAQKTPSRHSWFHVERDYENSVHGNASRYRRFFERSLSESDDELINTGKMDIEQGGYNSIRL